MAFKGYDSRNFWDDVLYSAGRYSDRTRYIATDLLYGIPVLGDAFRTQDSARYYDDYLSNRGLTYSDIRYHSRNTLGVGNMVHSGLSFVSKNIAALYR